MTPLRLIFMGTPAFAVPSLTCLVEAGHDIVAVYTRAPRPAGRGQQETPSSVHAYAASRNLPVFTPATLKNETVQQQFREHRADAAIVAAYGLLLPLPILTGTRMGCINVHPSLLPRWRGAAPLQRTVMSGDTESGVVIMKMDEGLDTGDMLLTKKISIPDGMNTGRLHDILATLTGPMLLETLQGLRDGTLPSIPQPEIGVTYAKKITKDERRIQWQEDAKSIRRKILGLSPAPGAYFLYKNEMIKILDAEIIDAASHDHPGTVINDGLLIACGKNQLRPMQLQRPGKKSISVLEMLKGYPIHKGERLE